VITETSEHIDVCLHKWNPAFIVLHTARRSSCMWIYKASYFHRV